MAPIRRLLGSSSVRIWLWQAAVTAVGIALLSWYLHEKTNTVLGSQFDQDILAELQTIVDEAETRGLRAAAHKVDRLLAADDSRGSYYLVLDAGGQRLAGNMPSVPDGLGWFSIPRSTVTTDAGRTQDRDHILRGRVDAIGGGRVAAARDTWHINEIGKAIWRSQLVYITAAVLITFGIAVVTSLYVRGRIRAFAKSSASIMAGDMDERIPVTPRRDEFDELALQINLMLDRIHALMAEISQVTIDIAHDLRTPLARLRHGIDAIRQSKRCPPELSPDLSKAVREADSILDIFTAMLRIAQIESGSRRAAFAPLSLSEIVTDVSETYAPVAEDQGHVLASRVNGEPVVDGDARLLRQLLSNLIENAMLHTKAGTRIEVLADQGAKRAVLSVADDGPGIPAVMREHVLKPFVRVDPSRTTEGTGLGLATVAAIVRLHAGEIELTDNAPGLRVSIHLPVNRSSGAIGG